MAFRNGEATPLASDWFGNGTGPSLGHFGKGGRLRKNVSLFLRELRERPSVLLPLDVEVPDVVHENAAASLREEPASWGWQLREVKRP